MDVDTASSRLSHALARRPLGDVQGHRSGVEEQPDVALEPSAAALHDGVDPVRHFGQRASVTNAVNAIPDQVEA